LAEPSKLSIMKNVPLFVVFSFLTTVGFAQNVTFSNKVANIIYNNCTTCHRQGAIAPFTLENYQDIYNNRYAIQNDVTNKVMPPWSPNSNYTHFLNERKLTSDQIALITNWVNNGAEEGDVATEPALPVFNDGSKLTNPDFSSRITPHTVNTPDNLDDFEFFSLPSGLTINASIKQMELVPSNRKIVHHIFVFIDSTGNFTKFVNDGGHVNGNNYISGGNLDELKLIGGWLPGGYYQTMPDNMGIRVPRNSHYIVQIHYAPGSNGQTDQTQLNIVYSREQNLRNLTVKPLLDNVVNLVGGPLFIPHDQIKVYHELYTVLSDISLVSIMPHQHKIGVRMLVWVERPSTSETIPLIDDKWDFHWQSIYTFPKVIHLQAGDIIHAQGTYDNTTNNRENPNYPPKDIVQGTSTLTEMMQVFFSYLPYQPGDENIDLSSINSPVIVQNADPISSFTVFPNPAISGGELNLKIVPSAIYGVELYSIDGKLIQGYAPMDASNKMTITLPQLPAGLYFVKVHNANNVTAQKFQVE